MIYFQVINLLKNYQAENDVLIEDYLSALNEFQLDHNNSEISNYYKSVRNQLEESSLLLNEKEKAELFDAFFYYNYAVTDKNSSVASFKPCVGIEKMYYVIRQTSSYHYNCL